jgi:hypothetical protein
MNKEDKGVEYFGKGHYEVYRNELLELLSALRQFLDDTLRGFKTLIGGVRDALDGYKRRKSRRHMSAEKDIVVTVLNCLVSEGWHSDLAMMEHYLGIRDRIMPGEASDPIQKMRNFGLLPLDVRTRTDDAICIPLTDGSLHATLKEAYLRWRETIDDCWERRHSRVVRIQGGPGAPRV